MENKFVKLERLMAVANSTENVVTLHQEQDYGEDEDDEEEEALSFCDLPLDHLSRKRTEEEKERIPLRAAEAQEDFHFCYLSKDSEMCDANEVFFQGQILPFRRSVSSDKGLFQYHRSISKSESIDGSSSSITLFSSRSSSISSSHRSYSSRSSAATTPQWRKLPHPPQNHSHSHRSSPPRTNFPIQGIIRTNNGICSKKTSSSSVWNIIRLGILVTSPPEIAFQDLKTRCPISNTNCKNFRSRNCTSRNSSNNKIISNTQKKKPRGFLIGGCNCSNDTVDTVRSRVTSMKKSPTEMEEQASVVQPTETPKKQGTHYRTFEWRSKLVWCSRRKRRKSRGPIIEHLNG